MKKTYMFIFLAVFLLIPVLSVSAQIYEIDSFVNKYAKAYDELVANTYKERADINYQDNYIEIPNGTEVTVKRIIPNKVDQLPNYLRFNAEIVYEGQTKYIYAWNLKFSDKNPEGTKDILKDYNMSPNMIQLDDKETGTKKVYNALDLRSPEGEMLMSPFFLLAIFVLLVSPLVINLVFIRSTNKVMSAFKFLYTVIAITVAIIMEGYYFIRLGPLAIWFCDVEFYSVMKAARNSIPLVLAIFAQIMSLGVINYSANQYADSRGKTFKLWPSIVLPILAFIAFMVLCFNLPSELFGVAEGEEATIAQVESAIRFLFTTLLIALPLPSVLYYGIKFKLRGLFLGIFYTFYWVGTLTVLGIFISVIVKLFLAIFFQVLIYVVGGIAGMWLMCKLGFSGHYVKNGRVVDSDTPGAKWVADTSTPFDGLFSELEKRREKKRNR